MSSNKNARTLLFLAFTLHIAINLAVMKIDSKPKPRVVIYVSPEELHALRKHAMAAGLTTAPQLVAQWVRQRLGSSQAAPR